MMKDTIARFVASAAKFSGLAFTPRFAKAFSAALVFHIVRSIMNISSMYTRKIRVAQETHDTRAGTVATVGMLAVDLLETDAVCLIGWISRHLRKCEEREASILFQGL